MDPNNDDTKLVPKNNIRCVQNFDSEIVIYFVSPI